MTNDTIIYLEILADDQRVNHTAKLFGVHFPMLLEPTIYTMADKLSADYTGGYWDLFTLSNGAFYMAPHAGQPFSVTGDNVHVQARVDDRPRVAIIHEERGVPNVGQPHAGLRRAPSGRRGKDHIGDAEPLFDLFRQDIPAATMVQGKKQVGEDPQRSVQELALDTVVSLGNSALPRVHVALQMGAWATHHGDTAKVDLPSGVLRFRGGKHRYLMSFIAQLACQVVGPARPGAINKPNKNSIGKLISANTAKILFYSLSVTGIIIGFYLAWTIDTGHGT